MKIGYTSDNHVQVNREKIGSMVQIKRMMHAVHAEGLAAFCVGGDMGDGMYNEDGETGPRDYDMLLGTHPDTFYVFGNHDLYRRHSQRVRPAIALAEHQRLFPASARLLEQSWMDEDTVFVKDDHAFVGSIGWCDFAHPGLRNPRAYYAHKDVCPIHDIDCIDLRKWCEDVDNNNAAFTFRLQKAIRMQDVRHIVVVLHTACFPTHSCEEPMNPMWPYFYNYRLGQRILHMAMDWPEKTFWVLAGHSHEFCRGVWGMEHDNLYTFGLKTRMDEQTLLVFDTEITDIARLRSTTAMRFVGGESRQVKSVFSAG